MYPSMVSYILYQKCLLSSPPEKLDRWAFHPILSPTEKLGAKIFHVLALAEPGGGGQRYLPAQISHLCSHLSPDSQNLPGPISTLRQARQKVILWPTPRRAGDIKCLDKFFSSPQKRRQPWFFTIHSVLSWGEVLRLLTAQAAILIFPPGR